MIGRQSIGSRRQFASF